jgi:asparagine synthase (glutamine-hydrolysing)
MCGIAGIVGLNGEAIDPAVLQRMNDMQSHRGPDGAGFVLGWVESGSFQHTFLRHTAAWDARAAVCLGLGHRRLAILDLSDRGLQPMASPDRRTWVVFNGEIYNFQDLRSDLKGQGHAFVTGTDTEVLLKAYLHWGEDCLARLEGMYAFAIWDGIRGRLFCARDRLGIKPFYYATPRGYFLFASEIKSLLSFPGLPTVADDEAVLGFLVHGNCDYGERTLFRGIKALPMAHSLVLDRDTGQLAVQRYWQLEPRPEGRVADTERIAQLRDLLLVTTRKHLISDVRAGSCLSGGLDSSTVVSLIGEICREQPEAAAAVRDDFCTFTSCYDRPEIDERKYALMVARSVGANPHLVFPSPEDFWSDFQRLAWHQDMPFGGLSFYAQWRVMRAAREAGVKVLLDGQGGDEVFGGYAKIRYAYLLSLARSGQIASMLHELVATLCHRDGYVLNLRNGFRYLPRRVRSLLQVDTMLKEVLGQNWDRAVSCECMPATRWWRNAAGRHHSDRPGTVVQQIQADDILMDTLPQLLRMEDRSSMAFSLEARVPLLDHKVVEYGVSLPDHLKIQKGWSKFAVREAMDNLLPRQVKQRKTKLGFAAPDRSWLAEELRPQVDELLVGDLHCSKYIDAAALRRWYRSPQARTATTQSYLGLFRVLSLEMWMRAFRIC